jgi:aspartate/methionine/tyrosine aminotransferase
VVTDPTRVRQPRVALLRDGLAKVPRSGIREVMELAAGVPGCIHLEVGEPDFPTPRHIVEAAAEAGRAGYTKYTPSRGYLSLREALAEKLKRANGLEVEPNDIVVTTGAVTALFEAVLATVEPGDVVLLPDPGWPNVEAMVLLVGGQPVRYPLLPDLGYEPDLDALRKMAVRMRPRAIYINSPGNPTGAVFSPETVRAICLIADQTGAIILADECYEAITFDAPHVSAATYLPQRTFTAYSFSKTYAMTGWRVGYLVTPPGLGEQMTKLQEPIISCATSVAQKAAEAALAGPQDCVKEMVAAYRLRRDRLVALLQHTDLLLTTPRGAFYAMVNVESAGMDVRSFVHRLVRQHGVAVAPGSTFGPSAAQAVRISLASDLASLEQGVERLMRAIQSPDPQ